MFQIDLMSRTPIYEQIQDQTEKLILAGVLHPRDRLPSVRSLSVQLSVNPNTIQRAYAELCSRGILVSMTGRGYFVCDDAAQVLQQAALRKFDALDALVRELLLAGISREQILAHITALPDPAQAPAGQEEKHEKQNELQEGGGTP